MVASTRRLLTCKALEVDASELDEALLGAPTGEEWAIALLFRSIQPDLLRFLAYRARDDADDLASETWLAVARALPGFSGSLSEFRALVFTIARRRVVDHYRREGHRPRTVPLAEVNEPPGTDRIADQVVEAISSREAIDRLVKSLPENQAEVVILRVVAGLSADEVALVTKRSAGAVRVLQHRALKRLLKDFSPGM